MATDQLAAVERNLPEFARVVRGLEPGLRGYLELLPRAVESPALAHIVPDGVRRALLLEAAKVRIEEIRGFCYVDIEVPCIVLGTRYYREGADLDLYLDLLHELTHLRQHADGRDVWDEAYAYVDRPTEIEGYAMAVAEARRLGLSDGEVMEHLTNPWMSAGDVQRLLANVEAYLAGPR
jgi:hypothetical protein